MDEVKAINFAYKMTDDVGDTILIRKKQDEVILSKVEV